MATVPWTTERNATFPAGVNTPGALAVTLTNLNDVSEWIPVSGAVNVLMDGGAATSTVEVYRSTKADYSDDVLIDTQSDTDRSGYYDFLGGGFVQFKLAAVASGPVTIRVTR